MSDVGVVIVTWNSRTDIEACLGALPAAAAGLALDVVVVDNASGDGTKEWLVASAPGVRVVANAENEGFARAVNTGVRHVGGRHLFLLNPDAVPAPGCLRLLVDALDKAPSCGLAAPVLHGSDGTRARSAFPRPGLRALAFEAFLLGNVFPHSRWHEPAPDREGTVACLPGTCLLVRRDCFSALSGLDERFFLYHEDFDFCLRAKATGWHARLVPEATAVHQGAAGAARDARAFHQRFEESRRQLLEKHLSPAKALLAAHLQETGLLLRIFAHGARGILLGRESELLRAGHEGAALAALLRRRRGHN